MTSATRSSSYIVIRLFLQRCLLAAAAVGFAASAHAAPDAPTANGDGDRVVQAPTERVAADGEPGAARATDGVPGASEPGGLVETLRERASDMVTTAMDFLGVPYRRGGSSETAGFDCSGFTRHIFERSIGLVLPRRADEQAKAPGLMTISRDQLRPGDLVFFNTLRRTFSHVGIYVGEGKFIHAPRPGGAVRVEDMGVSYWSRRFTGARRIDGDAAPVLRAMRLER